MSYARCSEDSDVYVYLGSNWYIHYCRDPYCSDPENTPPETYAIEGYLFRRLQELNASGVRVPWHTFERIKREIVTNRFVIKDGRKRCPYCQAIASNVRVSTEIGDELDNHYHCPACGAEEIPDPTIPITWTENEKLTGWFAPPPYSWYWDQTMIPNDEIPF